MTSRLRIHYRKNTDDELVMCGYYVWEVEYTTDKAYTTCLVCLKRTEDDNPAPEHRKTQGGQD